MRFPQLATIIVALLGVCGESVDLTKLSSPAHANIEIARVVSSLKSEQSELSDIVSSLRYAAEHDARFSAGLPRRALFKLVLSLGKSVDGSACQYELPAQIDCIFVGLHDGDPKTRIACAEALGRSNSTVDETRVILSELSSIGDKDEVGVVRVAAVASLVEQLAANPGIPKDTTQTVGAWALGMTKNPTEEERARYTRQTENDDLRYSRDLEADLRMQCARVAVRVYGIESLVSIIAEGALDARGTYAVVGASLEQLQAATDGQLELAEADVVAVIQACGASLLRDDYPTLPVRRDINGVLIDCCKEDAIASRLEESVLSWVAAAAQGSKSELVRSVSLETLEVIGSSGSRESARVRASDLVKSLKQ